MPAPDYKAFFTRYADVLNRSLGDAKVMEELRGVYAEQFIAAGSGGTVMGGDNDETYGKALREGAAFYRDVGLEKMTLLDVAVTAIDDGHDMVRAFFRAYYRKRSGERISIPFDLVYMLQRRPDGPRIFAYVAGDEMGLYRQYGLVGEDGKPA